MPEIADGRAEILRPGFSYLPQFITVEESQVLIAYFGDRTPLWERRHHGDEHGRSPTAGRRLTRPVYWLGAWQFACLGYYAEPEHRSDRCVRAEGFPEVMVNILDRLGDVLRDSHQAGVEQPLIPNTCLINYYGREIGKGVPRDYARLRMHRDGEPGPVIMFCVGQAGQLEFVDPERSPEPELSLWTRHRSVVILSGADFKDRLYHRIVQVRNGDKPQLSTKLEHFELRRVSVSFRHVPDDLIANFADLPAAKREQIREYVRALATQSGHWQAQDEGERNL